MLADPLYTAFRLVRGRQFTEAVAAYDDILRATPDKPHVWINRGVALQGLNRLDEAIVSYERALAIKPDYAAGYINRGVVRNWIADYGGALGDYDHALRLEPGEISALLGRSTVLSAMGCHEAAIADTDAVLKIQCGNGGAHYNKALCLLSMGDYAEGFREHEWRFGTQSILGPHKFSQRLWAGENTKKRILVHCEQGLGDSIQCARYLPIMVKGGLDVTLRAPPALIRLFSTLGVPVHDDREPPQPFDLHCPIMSLPAIFGTTLETVPAPAPLACCAPDPIVWARTDRPKIGLAWSSGVRPDQPIAVAMQRRKSVPKDDIAKLLYVPGAVFVSLQKDEPPDGLLGGMFDPMPNCRDLADTAGIIADLDLVISVDSAVAHVAASMGKPTWVLNRYDICWRWLSGTTESPWYPSAKVYRQSEPLRWGDVIEQVKHDLENLVHAT